MQSRATVLGALLVALLLLSPLAAPLLAQTQPSPDPDLMPEEDEQPEELEPEENEPLTQEFAYEVNFLPAGSDEFPEELADLLPQTSQLKALQDRPPQSQAGLERRVQNDLTLMDDALRSEGYYAAKLDWRIESGPPLQVNLLIDPGPRFVFGDFAVEFPAGANLQDLPQPNLDEVGIRLGEPARAAEVLAAERRMTDFLKNNGFPLARVTGRDVKVELTTSEMQVTLHVDTGPVASFGPLQIEGLTRLDEQFLRNHIEWPEGERYSAARLEEIRRELVALNLFDSVALETATQPLADGTLPTRLAVQERPPRTIGLGAGFSTANDSSLSGGFSVEGFWEHRNLYREADSLRVEGSMSLPSQTIEVTYRKPDFLQLEQFLVLNSAFRHEDTDTYKQLSLMGYVGIERPVGKHLTFAGGFSLEGLQIDDLDPDDDKGSQRFVIAALPTALTYDDRRDPLNPLGGYYATAVLTPSLSMLQGTTPYFVVDVSGATYYAPWDDDSFVLAVRARFGSIVGGSLDTIPASKRFYAGGGGSVRGYELRSIGPLDSDNEATGGLSVMEFGIEARTRFWDDYGLVAFVEGGQVYADTMPDFGETPLFGAGVGLRYFTELGPIRFDIATPLNGRDRDAAVQFYVSIGQAF